MKRQEERTKRTEGRTASGARGREKENSRAKVGEHGRGDRWKR